MITTVAENQPKTTEPAIELYKSPHESSQQYMSLKKQIEEELQQLFDRGRLHVLSQIVSNKIETENLLEKLIRIVVKNDFNFVPTLIGVMGTRKLSEQALFQALAQDIQHNPKIAEKVTEIDSLPKLSTKPGADPEVGIL